MDCKEVWKKVVGFENYEVSNLGNVRSITRITYHPRARTGVSTKKGRLLRPFPNHKGYLMVKLYQDGNQKSVSIHRLVATAFINNPLSFPQVNHKDENKQNNCVANLEWCTNDYNVHYGTAIKRKGESIRNSEAHKMYSKTRCKEVVQTDMNERIIKVWESVVSVETEGFCAEGVIDCCKGRRQSYKGFKWQYHNVNQI